MAYIKKIGNGVEIKDNDGTIYNFPLNTIILAAVEKSDMVNIKLKSYRRTIMSIPYKTIEEYTANNAEEMCKIIQKEINY